MWVKMKLPFLFEKVAESMWRAIGVGMQWKGECGDILPEGKVCKRRSTTWW